MGLRASRIDYIDKATQRRSNIKGLNQPCLQGASPAMTSEDFLWLQVIAHGTYVSLLKRKLSRSGLSSKDNN